MRALVGHSGFVGTNLKRSATFDGLYNSANVEDMAGRRYDLLVCAAAPATMWAANKDPAADLAVIERLARALRSAHVERMVLISTIAVLDDAAAGYDETNAAFEVGKAYGRHRRLLELQLAAYFPRLHILRLPALFGAGLKKNFIFDLLNPVPSFLKPDVFEELAARMDPTAKAMARRYFVLAPALGMMAFARDDARDTGALPTLEAAFTSLDFTAARFTNSESRFQYYGLHRLWGDIETVIARGLPVLHVASEPLRAADVHVALTGRPFENAGAPIYAEDMRTRHAAAWNAPGCYLYSAAETLADLRAFYAGARH